jgi:hypothetical protein
MRKEMAAAIRYLADKIDGCRLVAAVEYIKTHPGLTTTEMRELLGSMAATTKS